MGNTMVLLTFSLLVPVLKGLSEFPDGIDRDQKDQASPDKKGERQS